MGDPELMKDSDGAWTYRLDRVLEKFVEIDPEIEDLLSKISDGTSAIERMRDVMVGPQEPRSCRSVFERKPDGTVTRVHHLTEDQVDALLVVQQRIRTS